MEIVVVPSYEDIFKENKPELINLIDDIPTHFLIPILAHIEAQLFLDNSINNQLNILTKVLARQNETTKLDVIKNYNIFMNNHPDTEVYFISRLYLKSFFHQAILNGNNLKLDSIHPKHELNILKAYLLISSERNSITTNNYSKIDKNEKGDFFQVHTWPIMVNQLDIIDYINPINNIFKGVSLLNYLQFHSKYSKYVECFLKKNNKPNAWEYIMSLMNVLVYCWGKNDNNDRNYYFSCDDNYKYLFDNLSVIPEDYKNDFREKIENLSGIKSKPLYKYENRYYIIDCNFIANKVYDGLIFDFFNNSGLKETSDIKSIPEFKKLIGYDITEKFIFNRLLKSILTNKYAKLILPDNDNNGEPDGYYRIGNSIMIFEIKDAFFSAKAIESSSYKEIKKEIDTKFNGKKGTGQLIRHIKELKNKPFESDIYSNGKVKARNLKIYPILIYTDKHYSMPGVSNYLINEFDKKIEDLKLRSSYEKIQPLTFLDLNFIIQNSKFLKNENLFKILDSLHHEVFIRRKKHDKYNRQDLMFRFNENIEMIFDELYNLDNENRTDIKGIMNSLDLRKGLPEK